MSDKPYERVSIGVYRHHQKFRAFKIMGGEVLQEYFASQAQAEEWRNRDADRSEKFATRKSARARAQDLPIGLCDVSQKRQRSYGTVIVPTIRAYIRHRKELVKVISRTYGTSRSREEAVLEVSSHNLVGQPLLLTECSKPKRELIFTGFHTHFASVFFCHR